MLLSPLVPQPSSPETPTSGPSKAPVSSLCFFSVSVLFPCQPSPWFIRKRRSSHPGVTPHFSIPSLLVWKNILCSGSPRGFHSFPGDSRLDRPQRRLLPQCCGQPVLLLSYILPKLPSDTHSGHKPHKHPRTFQDLEDPRTPSWVRVKSCPVTHPWAPQGETHRHAHNWCTHTQMYPVPHRDTTVDTHTRVAAAQTHTHTQMRSHLSTPSQRPTSNHDTTNLQLHPT